MVFVLLGLSWLQSLCLSHSVPLVAAPRTEVARAAGHEVIRCYPRATMLMDFERLLNHVNDTDHEWGPFLFLRPGREERMTSLRVGGLAALYGILAGCFVNVV